MSNESLAMAGKHDVGAAGRMRVGRLWRKCGTGLCFVVYGAVGWLGGLTVLPLIMLWPGSPAARERRIRGVVSWSFRWLLVLIAVLRVGHVEIEGREWLDQVDGRLLVANHPMYLDVVALVGLLPQADCVIKRAMWRNRLYRRFVEATGYISNAGNVDLLDDCVASLRRGRPLILFPEGTRSTPGEPLHFCRGAAQVAVRSGCEVLPVVIHCDPLALGKGQAWHTVSDRPWRLRVRICPPRTLSELGWREDMPHGVAARRVTQTMQDFFTRQLKDPATAVADADMPRLAMGAMEDA
ncbi:MAG TPA: lysophospholipid acyltransferase family protein [Oleiagrimonas sp.]|nr:lysophospholipid acyltransferase family protein [Oleiagrimonas sp.]